MPMFRRLMATLRASSRSILPRDASTRGEDLRTAADSARSLLNRKPPAGSRRLYLAHVLEILLCRRRRSRGGRPALRPDEPSRACCVDRPPALFSNAVEESKALASLHSQAGREKVQGRGAETSAYPRRPS